VLETAEKLAEFEPARHERTLFILSTLFAMYLRVSDVVGRQNWKRSMGDFRQDPEGNWWYHAVGKGNKVGKIVVRDEYINLYLKRYRRFLGLPEFPEIGETTPLIKTLRGRSGLSDRQVRALLQVVFDKALESMRIEGRAVHEMESSLIRCINRLEEHQEGHIVVDGVELTGQLKRIDRVRSEYGGVHEAIH
jgi:hypothetical protein